MSHGWRMASEGGAGICVASGSGVWGGGLRVWVQEGERRTHPKTPRSKRAIWIFLKVCAPRFSATLKLNYNRIGDNGMQSFSTAITSGALGLLKELRLQGNQIGSKGMKAFSTAITPGMGHALGRLQQLWLDDNRIGNDGMQAVSTAIASGALAKCQHVKLLHNWGESRPVVKALRDRKNKRSVRSS